MYPWNKRYTYSPEILSKSMYRSMRHTRKKSPLYHFATGIQCKPAVSTFSISEHIVYDFHCSLVLCHELTCVLFLTVSPLPGRAGVGPLSPPHYTWPPASPPHSGHDTPRWRPASHSTTDKLLLTKRGKVAAPAPPLFFLSFYKTSSGNPLSSRSTNFTFLRCIQIVLT